MKNGLSGMCNLPAEGRYSRQDSVFRHHIEICRGRDFKERIKSFRSDTRFIATAAFVISESKVILIFPKVSCNIKTMTITRTII